MGSLFERTCHSLLFGIAGAVGGFLLAHWGMAVSPFPYVEMTAYTFAVVFGMFASLLADAWWCVTFPEDCIP